MFTVHVHAVLITNSIASPTPPRISHTHPTPSKSSFKLDKERKSRRRDTRKSQIHLERYEPTARGSAYAVTDTITQNLN